MHFPPKDSDVGEAESTLGAIMKAAARTNFGRGCTQAFCHVTENRNTAFVFFRTLAENLHKAFSSEKDLERILG